MRRSDSEFKRFSLFNKPNIRARVFDVVMAVFAITCFVLVCTLFLIADTTGWW